MAAARTVSNQVIDLCRRAEEKAAKIIERQETRSSEETRQILHELRVHQIELEIQNVELRQAQTELDAARARYFDLYDLAPVGYFTISREGRILEANLTAAKLLGNTRIALIKQPITRFIHKEDRDGYYLLRKQLFETGEPQICELQMEKKDGTSFWARLEATVAADSDGAPVSRVVMSDITDHKRVEAGKAKNEAQNRQLQKAKSLGLMAGAIAHHFNNQLQVVMGGLEMAINDLPPGGNPTQSLLSAMKAARKAAEVSGLMLTYLGQTPGKHEPMDLSEACRRNLILLQAAAPKGTLFKADFPASGPVIRANAGQIQHVLTNLITNAWESAGKNRRAIGLTVKTVSQSDLLAIKGFPVDWEPRDPAYACLEIADAGCGIAEENIEKIFDPFFSTKFTGRGLGLPVVLGIVRAHHGGVTVESEPDRGSIFRVFLPVSVEAVPRQPDSAAQIQQTQEGGTLLVVEDEKMVREITAATLRQMGFSVLEARDGIEAVKVFRQHRHLIRCVVCDLTMPRMDGWETLAALRGMSPGIPFVLSSGYDEDQVMAGDHTELPHAFLGKPYRLEELRDSIRRALANKN